MLLTITSCKSITYYEDFEVPTFESVTGISLNKTSENELGTVYHYDFTDDVKGKADYYMSYLINNYDFENTNQKDNLILLENDLYGVMLFITADGLLVVPYKHP